MIDNKADLTGKLAIDANGLGQLKQASRENSPEAVKEVARQFEAVFVNMMLKSMRDASPQDGVFDNEQTRTFTSMLDQQLSQTMSQKGMGLADVLARQLSKAGMPPEELDAHEGLSAATPFTPRQDGLRAYSATSTYPVHNAAPPTAVAGSGSNANAFQNAMAPHAAAASRATGIPAHFMLGQAALESGWGKREIKGANGENSHNLFGIKAGSNWTGKTVDAVTTEYVNGVKQHRVEKFRAYDSYADSFKDFASLITSNPRYGNAVNNVHDVNAYAQGLQNGGYATDPNYASKLVKVIQKISA